MTQYKELAQISSQNKRSHSNIRDSKEVNQNKESREATREINHADKVEKDLQLLTTHMEEMKETIRVSAAKEQKDQIENHSKGNASASATASNSRTSDKNGFRSTSAYKPEASKNCPFNSSRIPSNSKASKLEQYKKMLDKKIGEVSELISFILL